MWDGIKSAAGAVKDWAKEFGSDALQCGKDFYNAQCERTDKFFNKPNLLNFVDYVSFGWCSANEERFNRADDLYGVVNYVSLGALDMVNGAFNPEKPFSFDHIMNSIGTASLVTGSYAAYKHSYNSNNITQNKKLMSKSNKSTIKSIDDILEDAAPGRATKGRATQYVKTGGYAQALDDFSDLGVTNVREIPSGKVGTLPDGRTINVRTKSSDGRVTLEIYDGKSSIKIRYED